MNEIDILKEKIVMWEESLDQIDEIFVNNKLTEHNKKLFLKQRIEVHCEIILARGVLNSWEQDQATKD